ncbi:MAG: hypothetical protein LBC94_02840 [Desulfovibrio sp.]|jgi:hypothetical protein|nr:hypothetical protein [Desulfovibrio sp.]
MVLNPSFDEKSFIFCLCDDFKNGFFPRDQGTYLLKGGGGKEHGKSLPASERGINRKYPFWSEEKSSVSDDTVLGETIKPVSAIWTKRQNCC